MLTGDGFDSASARGVSRCGFGAAEDVAAFPDGTSSMSCATPNATLAGLASTLVVDFTSEELLEPLVEDDALEGLNVVTGELDALRRDNAVRDLASGGKLLGGARLMPPAYGDSLGFVRLADSAYAGSGACVLPLWRFAADVAAAAGPEGPAVTVIVGADGGATDEEASAGGPAAHVDHSGRHGHAAALGASTLAAFDAQFDVRIWGQSGRHGLSFCYGELPGRAWAEGGGSLGLCVMLKTTLDRVQVLLHGKVIADAPPPDGTPLRWREWRRVRVVHSDATGGLRVELHGATLIDGVALPGFRPAPSWRFGFGARAGPSVEMNRSATTSAWSPSPSAPRSHRWRSPSPSHSTRSGLDERERGELRVLCRRDASSVAPAVGPSTGETALVLRARLRGGSDYRCRFVAAADGAWLRETGRSSSTIARSRNSTAPGGAAHGYVTRSHTLPLAAADELLLLTLNGQQYEAPPLNYSVRDQPTILGLSPSSGPPPVVPRSRSRSRRAPAADHHCRFGGGGASTTTWTSPPLTMRTLATSSCACRRPLQKAARPSLHTRSTASSLEGRACSRTTRRRRPTAPSPRAGRAPAAPT